MNGVQTGRLEGFKWLSAAGFLGTGVCGCNCAVGKLRFTLYLMKAHPNQQTALWFCVSLSTAPLTSSCHVSNPAACIIPIAAPSVALKSTARLQFKLLSTCKKKKKKMYPSCCPLVWGESKPVFFPRIASTWAIKCVHRSRWRIGRQTRKRLRAVRPRTEATAGSRLAKKTALEWPWRVGHVSGAQSTAPLTGSYSEEQSSTPG